MQATKDWVRDDLSPVLLLLRLLWRARDVLVNALVGPGVIEVGLILLYCLIEMAVLAENAVRSGINWSARIAQRGFILSGGSLNGCAFSASTGGREALAYHNLSVGRPVGAQRKFRVLSLVKSYRLHLNKSLEKSYRPS